MSGELILSPLPTPHSLFFCPLGVQRANVAADVFAVSARVFKRARPRQTVISTGQIDETHQINKIWQGIIRRVADIRRNSHDDVFLEFVSGEEKSERVQARAAIAAQHAVKIVPRDVIAKDKSGAWRAVEENERAALKDSVVVNRDVGRPPDDLREPAVRRPVCGAAPFIAVNVVNQVVLDQDSLRRLARRGVVRPRDVEAIARMPQDVVGEGHVLSRRLRRHPILAARREEYGEADLRVRPVVFKDVLIYEQSLGVFQFEKILDRPGPSGVSGMTFLPRERFIDVVQSELDVGRDQVLNRWLSPAEHNVLTRALQVVVDDFERTRSVPSANRLRVESFAVAVRDVRIDHSGAGAVEHNATSNGAGVVAMNVAAVNDQIVRRLS